MQHWVSSIMSQVSPLATARLIQYYTAKMIHLATVHLAMRKHRPKRDWFLRWMPITSTGGCWPPRVATRLCPTMGDNLVFRLFLLLAAVFAPSVEGAEMISMVSVVLHASLMPFFMTCIWPHFHRFSRSDLCEWLKRWLYIIPPLLKYQNKHWSPIII